MAIANLKTPFLPASVNRIHCVEYKKRIIKCNNVANSVKDRVLCPLIKDDVSAQKDSN